MHALKSPALHRRVSDKGYEVVYLDEVVKDRDEKYHRISLRPKKE